jgi:hypothetical protein
MTAVLERERKAEVDDDLVLPSLDDYLSSSELGVVELTTLSGDLTRVSID